ncbi:MAG: hypothetical protein QM767_14420 [Anaeromyxobacter sp.]
MVLADQGPLQPPIVLSGGNASVALSGEAVTLYAGTVAFWRNSAKEAGRPHGSVISIRWRNGEWLKDFDHHLPRGSALPPPRCDFGNAVDHSGEEAELAAILPRGGRIKSVRTRGEREALVVYATSNTIGSYALRVAVVVSDNGRRWVSQDVAVSDDACFCGIHMLGQRALLVLTEDFDGQEAALNVWLFGLRSGS